MKSTLLFVLSLTFILFSCGESVEESIATIKQAEDSLFSSKDKFDIAKADMLIRNYDLFASKHPKHEKAAQFLFRAGDLSTGLNKSEQAIGFFDRVCENYPDFEKAPDALFLKAFVLENQLKNYDEAEKNYRAFIDKYPDHAMVSSAEFSIKNLGIPTEDLIKSFENQMDSSKANQPDSNQAL